MKVNAKGVILHIDHLYSFIHSRSLIFRLNLAYYAHFHAKHEGRALVQSFGIEVDEASIFLDNSLADVQTHT